MRVALATRDGDTRVDVTVELSDELRGSELFADLAEASRFFRGGAKGFSATGSGRHLDAMELRTSAWHVDPGRVRSAASSYFDDPDRFPTGSATLDCALVMRGVPVSWRPLPAMASQLAD
jgi:hypothetical protein